MKQGTALLLFLLLLLGGTPVRAQEDSLAFEKTLAGKSPEEQVGLLLKKNREEGRKLPARALAYARRAYTIAVDLGTERLKQQAHMGMARSYRKLGNYERSLELADEVRAYSLARNDESLLTESWLESGNALSSIGEYEKSIKAYVEADKIAVRKKDYDTQIACQNNIGSLLFTLGELDKAIPYFQRAHEISKQMGDQTRAALALDNIGQVLNAKGNIDSALLLNGRAADIVGKAGDTLSLIEVLIARGSYYEGKGSLDDAKETFFRTLQLSRERSYDLGIVLSLLNISEISREQHDSLTAIIYARKALEQAKSGGLSRWIMESYNSITELYEAAGQPDSALISYRNYLGIRDSVFGAEKQQQVHDMSISYENDKKDNEIKILENEKEQRKLVLWGFSVGLLLLVLIVWLVIRSNMRQRKDNRILEEQNLLIEAKNRDILDSINYAQRIQRALLPDMNTLPAPVTENFLYYQPRDIVSGDFYWFAEKKGYLYIAAADCTGHGVPGALVSVLGINILNEIMSEEGTPDTAELLGVLHRKVIQAMNKDVHMRESKDGMDIALLRIDSRTKEVCFSGAGRPLFYADGSSEQLQQLPGDRMSIAGAKAYDDSTPYSKHVFTPSGRTVFYLFSDGLPDQFGGEKNKKFLVRRLSELLEKGRSLPAAEQKNRVAKAMDEWKGNQEQTDDMLLLGIVTG